MTGRKSRTRRDSPFGRPAVAIDECGDHPDEHPVTRRRETPQEGRSDEREHVDRDPQQAHAAATCLRALVALAGYAIFNRHRTSGTTSFLRAGVPAWLSRRARSSGIQVGSLNALGAQAPASVWVQAPARACTVFTVSVRPIHAVSRAASDARGRALSSRSLRVQPESPTVGGPPSRPNRSQKESPSCSLRSMRPATSRRTTVSFSPGGCGHWYSPRCSSLLSSS